MAWAAVAPVLEHKKVGIIEKHLRIFLPLCVCVCVHQQYVCQLYSVIVVLSGPHKFRRINFLRQLSDLISHELKEVN